MHDNRTHPLLEQVPLTVSPFVNLPTATTLPYTYKTMPSTLPPSATGIASSSSTAAADGTSGTDAVPAPKPQYVVSASGHAAHPDDIIASCRALQAHVAKLQADAEAELRALEDRMHARDLAEKRRVAPGWLDSDARMLEPERVDKGKGKLVDGGVGIAGVQGRLAGLSIGGTGGASEMAVPDEGEELDRAFGGMALAR